VAGKKPGTCWNVGKTREQQFWKSPWQPPILRPETVVLCANIAMVFCVQSWMVAGLDQDISF
jgi:hypothetical protein